MRKKCSTWAEGRTPPPPPLVWRSHSQTPPSKPPLPCSGDHPPPCSYPLLSAPIRSHPLLSAPILLLSAPICSYLPPCPPPICPDRAQAELVLASRSAKQQTTPVTSVQTRPSSFTQGIAATSAQAVAGGQQEWQVSSVCLPFESAFRECVSHELSNAHQTQPTTRRGRLPWGRPFLRNPARASSRCVAYGAVEPRGIRVSSDSTPQRRPHTPTQAATTPMPPPPPLGQLFLTHPPTLSPPLFFTRGSPRVQRRRLQGRQHRLGRRNRVESR